VTRVSGPAYLQLGHGEVETNEGVLAGLGLALGVAGDGGFDARVGREADEQDHQEREERDRDQQREAASGAARRRAWRAEG
jgi:hypothetical protein